MFIDNGYHVSVSFLMRKGRYETGGIYEQTIRGGFIRHG